MKPYIVKFQHFTEEMDGSMTPEDVFLCVHAKHRLDAQAKYLQITGGESRNSFLVSVTGKDKIEAFWDRNLWKFVTIPS